MCFVCSQLICSRKQSQKDNTGIRGSQARQGLKKARTPFFLTLKKKKVKKNFTHETLVNIDDFEREEGDAKNNCLQ
jgi:hypothetical protein